MVWSYSRVHAFDFCPYAWYLKYIARESDEKLFFAGYGSFMHRILAQYYGGEITKQEAIEQYLCGFLKEVDHPPPSSKIFHTYFNDGLRFLSEIAPLPYHDIVAEQELHFTVFAHPFTCFIDLQGRSEDGKLAIIDHKSRNLRPPSGKKRPTAYDEERELYFRQLYLYAEAVFQNFGAYPDVLGLNCFRNGMFITQKFSKVRHDAVLEEIEDTIRSLREESDFPPSPEYFKCTHLCGFHQQCEYYRMNYGK